MDQRSFDRMRLSRQINGVCTAQISPNSKGASKMEKGQAYPTCRFTKILSNPKYVICCSKS